MAKYRTAQGKVVDMSVLAAKNEKTRAVGNMKVNARGDTIDAMGRIIKPATAKVNENYAKTVGNRSAQPVRQQTKSTPAENARVRQPARPASAVNTRISEEELSELEKDLDFNSEDDLAAEQIKAKETGNK